MLIAAYLKFHITPLNTVNTTLNEMVSTCGYSVKGNSKETNAVFKEALKEMIEDKYIRIDNIDEIKNSQFFIIYCNYSKLFHCASNFVLLSYEEFKVITTSNTSTKKTNLLHGYLLIKQYIYDSLIVNCPKLAYPSKKDITDKLGFSSDTSTETLLNELVELKLLYVKTGMYIKKDDKLVPTRNVYAIDKKQLKYAVNVLKKFYGVNYIYTASGKSQKDLKFQETD